MRILEKFDTEKDAIADMYQKLNDDNEWCNDNDRIGYYDDEKSMQAYKNIKSKGCCGFRDYDVIIAGRKAIIGCNFGH